MMGVRREITAFTGSGSNKWRCLVRNGNRMQTIITAQWKYAMAVPAIRQRELQVEAPGSQWQPDADQHCHAVEMCDDSAGYQSAGVTSRDTWFAMATGCSSALSRSRNVPWWCRPPISGTGLHFSRNLAGSDIWLRIFCTFSP